MHSAPTKHLHLVVPILSTAALFLFVAVSSYPDGAPAARTGAPGDATCNAFGCHNTFQLNNGPGSVAISTAAEYQPGEAFNVVVTVSQQGQSRFGFEITARDEDDNFVGSWDLGANQQFADGNTEYVTHDLAPFVDDENAFSMTWNAPAAGTGTVTFYAAGNAANGNGLNTGDYIYTTSADVSEATDTAVESTEIPKALEVASVFPNPVVSSTTIQYDLMRSATTRLSLYDAAGRLVRTLDGGHRSPGRHRFDLSADGLPGGVYLYRLETTAGAESGKLMIVR